jgi:uncharacterized protein (TIGR02271 family)
MSRTVTALYDTKAEAEAARERLAREVDIEGRARIIDQNSSRAQEGERELDFENVPLPSEEPGAYRKGIHRGGFMLCAEVDEDEDCDKIVSILEQTTSVDVEDPRNIWRSKGSDEEAGGIEESAGGQIVEEQRVPLVEEQLRVGKREIERGGARVRSYVEELPVEETVVLREEHVEVERRPIDEAVQPGDLEKNDLFEERTIEMRERAEEPVVGKEARVREEVVMRKAASQRVEQVQDTVRRTDAYVQDGGAGNQAESSRGLDPDG